MLGIIGGVSLKCLRHVACGEDVILVIGVSSGEGEFDAASTIVDVCTLQDVALACLQGSATGHVNPCVGRQCSAVRTRVTADDPLCIVRHTDVTDVHIEGQRYEVPAMGTHCHRDAYGIGCQWAVCQQCADVVGIVPAVAIACQVLGIAAEGECSIGTHRQVAGRAVISIVAHGDTCLICQPRKAGDGEV